MKKRNRPSRPRMKLNRSTVSELLNLSQTQLAQLCGISPGYFSLLMAGKRNASPFTRQRLQQVLGVSDFHRLFIMEHSGDGLDNTSFAHLWLAGDAAISGATGSAYTLADSDEGKPIKVRVNFTDDAGNEETLISAATAAVEPTPAPPPAPTNLTAVVNEGGWVTLTWDAPDDNSVTGYQVLRRRPHEGEETLLVHVENTGSTATTYTDTNVMSGVRYVYRVKAINAAGLSQWSNYARATP